MKRTALTAALFVVALPLFAADPLPRSRPESVGMSSERLQRLTAAIKAEVDQGNMPGAVIAIARKGRLVYYEAIGYADKAKNTPMPKDAIFHIGSMTKPMTVVGALMLYEQNRMLLNVPVETYLPQLAKMQVAVARPAAGGDAALPTEPARRSATIHDLMRHTAGMPYGSLGTTALHKMYPQGSMPPARALSGEEFVQTMAKLPLHHQPGTKWDYGLAIDVLGLAIEAVTKQSLVQYFDENLFRPLGMTDTGFVVSAENAKRYARPLPTDPVTGKPLAALDPTRPWRFDCGGGCAVSTTADFLRFAQMLLNGGRLGDARLLGRKTVEYMTSDHLGPGIDADRLRALLDMDGWGFGLGVAVRRTPGMAGIAGSAGDYMWNNYHGTYFWVDPREQLAVVFMANTPGHPGTRVRLRQVAHALVLQAIVD